MDDEECNNNYVGFKAAPCAEDNPFNHLFKVIFATSSANPKTISPIPRLRQSRLSYMRAVKSYP